MILQIGKKFHFLKSHQKLKLSTREVGKFLLVVKLVISNTIYLFLLPSKFSTSGEINAGVGQKDIKILVPLYIFYSWTSWAGEFTLPSALDSRFLLPFLCSQLQDCPCWTVLSLYSYLLESRQRTCPQDRTFPEGEPSWGFPYKCSSFFLVIILR